MKGLVVSLALVAGVLTLSACEGLTVQGGVERAVATKDIALATLNAICARPEDDVVRTDIRKALVKVSPVDSRKICSEGLDVYLTEVVTRRLQGEVVVTPAE